MKDLREEHKEFIRQKRQEARDAVDVMERSVEAKLAQERDRNGMSPSFFFFFFFFFSHQQTVKLTVNSK